ncbi:metallophosphoesterase family protein [Candidatus Formimonas warabiya]|uniref:Phosphoesterase n=1 Tax=Formimonas warabiya TaxID=1761012 RepID=A0A3G1KV83_FORW1|nr:YfcE family phosphodiesterase [Candidatus Formimonas warabiya]ATW26359.1 YfcE family phosphodiesterase [Candidatus Formimonas warabiya]
MRIAVFSDVHGNLAALQAVLADVEKRKVDYTVCAGDLVGYAPFPNEVIHLIQERNIPCVMGNYDDGVGFFRPVCGCDFKDDQARLLGEQSLLWTKKHTSEENKEFLRFLPYEIRIEAAGKRLLIVHGSPKALNEYLSADTSEHYLKGLLEEEDTDVLICGHTHIPCHKQWDQGHLVNAGSIGKPKHGKSSAVYALIQITKGIAVEFLDVAYDVEATASAIEKSDLPDAFAHMLRKGH